MKDQRDSQEDAATLRLVEEEVDVSKRKLVTGRIDVRTVTDTVDEIVKATVQGQTVDVTRVLVNRTVETAPAVRTEGDLTIIPVVEEVLVIEKRLLLKEEVHIRRTTRDEEIETTVPLRRQRAIVERHDAGTAPLDPDPTTSIVPDKEAQP